MKDEKTRSNISTLDKLKLRQRMIEDMPIRQFGEKTQRDYVYVVRSFETAGSRI